MIDKYAPALGSQFCSIPAFLIHVYRYILMVYQYTFDTVDFLIRCTGTRLGCTGTLCPLPLLLQGVPVHINDVPVHLVLWCFPSIAEVPETSSIVRPHPQCFILASRILSASYWLPGQKSLYTYVLYLKDLHKSKNTQKIKSTYPFAE